MHRRFGRRVAAVGRLHRRCSIRSVHRLRRRVSDARFARGSLSPLKRSGGPTSALQRTPSEPRGAFAWRSLQARLRRLRLPRRKGGWATSRPPRSCVGHAVSAAIDHGNWIEAQRGAVGRHELGPGGGDHRLPERDDVAARPSGSGGLRRRARARRSRRVASPAPPEMSGSRPSACSRRAAARAASVSGARRIRFTPSAVIAAIGQQHEVARSVGVVAEQTRGELQCAEQVRAAAALDRHQLAPGGQSCSAWRAARRRRAAGCRRSWP